MKKTTLTIRKGMDLAQIDHCGFKLYFLPSFETEGKYADVREEVSKQGLFLPTMGEAASLVYAALQNPQESFAKELIEKMQGRPFWTDSGILTAKTIGTFVQDHPEIDEQGNIIMAKENLIGKVQSKIGTPLEIRKILYSKTGAIRYNPSPMPLSELGDLPLDKMETNKLPYLLAGVQGAKKLMDIANHAGSELMPKSEIVYIGGASKKGEINIPAIYFSTKNPGKLVIAADECNTRKDNGFTIPRLSVTADTNTRTLEQLFRENKII